MLDFFNSLNQNLFYSVHQLVGQNIWLDNLMIFGANYPLIITPICTLILAIVGEFKDRKAFFLAGVSSLLALGLLKLIQLLLFEPRPFVTYHFTPLISHLPDASFPSQHSTALSILALSFFVYKSRYGKYLVVPLVWTGLARVYTGVHYPADILGGFILGAISVAIVWQIKKRVLNRLFLP